MTQPHKAECLVIGGAFAGAFALCLTASSAWHWIGGFSLWGVGEALRSRRQLEYVEVFRGAVDYCRDAAGEVNEAALPFTREVEQQKTKLVVSALRQLPMGDRMADNFIAQQGLTTEWFEGFEKRSAVVCGESKDGKTFLLNWRVERFLQNHPDGELLICDPDYGSSHEGEQPNTWFNLPIGAVVQIEPNDITSAIFSVADEVSSRAKKTAQAAKDGKAKPTFRPLLLVVDEWGTYWDSLSEATQETVLQALKNISDRGIKQGHVTFVLGLHDLSVGSTGLPRALLRKLEVLLLWRAAQSKRNFDNLDAPEKQIDEAIARIRQLPKTVRDVRPCVVWADKAVTVKALPTLQLSSIELVAPEAIDPDQQWMDEVWTPEFEILILRRMMERQQQGKQVVALSEYWTMAGQAPKDQRRDNPRYMLFRSRVEAISAGIPESTDLGGGRCPDDSEIAAVSTSSDLQPSAEISPSSQNQPE